MISFPRVLTLEPPGCLPCLSSDSMLESVSVGASPQALLLRSSGNTTLCPEKAYNFQASHSPPKKNSNIPWSKKCLIPALAIHKDIFGQIFPKLAEIGTYLCEVQWRKWNSSLDWPSSYFKIGIHAEWSQMNSKAFTCPKIVELPGASPLDPTRGLTAPPGPQLESYRGSNPLHPFGRIFCCSLLMNQTMNGWQRFYISEPS